MRRSWRRTYSPTKPARKPATGGALPETAVPPPPTSPPACPNCDDSRRCPTCNGSGAWYQGTWKEEECGTCRGSGRCRSC